MSPFAAQPRQRGAALLAAMLTVTLVATFAATAAWQQWRAVEIETAERARSQAGWILVGALDWSRLILSEDNRPGPNNDGTDNLTEPWAVPLQEARLSSFLAADKNNTALSAGEDDVELFLSGQIVDMQSRLNVLNLVKSGQISPPHRASFAKLFDLLKLDPIELVNLADNLRTASDPNSVNTPEQPAPLMPSRVAQLVWLGLSASSLERLAPFITLIPFATPVNMNTAPAEVLYASLPSLDLEGARRIETERARKHFNSNAQIAQLVPAIANELKPQDHSFSTRFFEVRGRIRLAETVVQERSLVERNGLVVKTVWRERATLPKFDPAGSLQ
jgi:general secretion pathway protein K